MTKFIMSFSGLALMAGVSYYINTKALTQPTWDGLLKMVFHPGIIIYYGVISTLVIWSLLKVMYNVLGDNIWLFIVIQNIAISMSRITGVWLASGVKPSVKDTLALTLQVISVCIIAIDWGEFVKMLR